MLPWPYWVVLVLVVVPGISCALSRRFPGGVLCIGSGLIGFCCLAWLILDVASRNHWPLNPVWTFGIGFGSLLFGISTLMGVAIGKITSWRKGP
jgi:hypothetical protein